MSSNATNPLPQRLDALTSQLHPLESMAAQRIEKLRHAVTTPGPEGAAWAASDVHRLIAPGEVAERFYPPVPPDARLRQLELARNLAILTPLLVTWLGIWNAVENYRALLSDPTNQALIAQPFLLLWQRGFESRIRYGTLGHLAIVDVVLLALVLLLTWLTQRRFNDFNKKVVDRERAVENLRAELDDALAEARLTLATQYPTQPIQVVAQFDQSLQGLRKELAEERKTLRDMITQRETELQALVERHKTEHEALLAQRETELKVLAEQRRAEYDAVTRQREEEYKAVTAFVSDFKQGAGDMLTSAKELKPVVDQVARGIAELERLGKDMQRQQGELLVPAQTAANRLVQLVQIQEMLANALRGAIGALNAAVEQLDTSVKTLNAITPTFTKATDQFNDTSTKLISEQRSLVAALDQERAALAYVAMTTSRATVGLDQALSNVQKYAKDLYAATVHLNELSRALAPTLQAFTDLSSLAKANSDTAKRLTQAMEKVDIAATAVDTAIRSLSTFPPSGDGAS